MVRPEEVSESFPNEGKHESVLRVKHVGIQSTTDLSRFGGRGAQAGGVGLQGSGGCRTESCGRVFHREDTIPGIMSIPAAAGAAGCTDCN